MKLTDYMGQGGQPPGDMPPEGAPPPERGAMPPEQGAQQTEFGEPATPEEQQSYDQVVMAASQVLYSDQTNPRVLKMLEAGADNPAQAIADVATMVIVQLDEQSGGTIPEVVIIPAAAEIAELVAELAQKRGIFEVNDQVMGQAGQLLLLSVADQYDVSEEELAELVQSVDPAQAEQIVAQQSQYGVV